MCLQHPHAVVCWVQVHFTINLQGPLNTFVIIGLQIVNTLNWILLVCGTLNNHNRSQGNVIKSENQKLTTVTTYGLVFTSLIVFFQ